jgi:hypothetical protein
MGTILSLLGGAGGAALGALAGGGVGAAMGAGRNFPWREYIKHEGRDLGGEYSRWGGVGGAGLGTLIGYLLGDKSGFGALGRLAGGSLGLFGGAYTGSALAGMIGDYEAKRRNTDMDEKARDLLRQARAMGYTAPEGEMRLAQGHPQDYYLPMGPSEGSADARGA